MKPMTLDELESRLRSDSDPRTLLGDDPPTFLKAVKVLCHPDRFIDDPGDFPRAEALRRQVEAIADAASKPKSSVIIKSPKREYTLVRSLGTGDVADVHLATSAGKEYAVKVSRISEGVRFLDAEQKALAEILGKSGRTHYDRYFPTPCESFPVRDSISKRVNVFLFEPGFYTLEEVHAAHPALDGRHLAWIFKRLLTAVGFAHRCGFVHGAVLPSHVRIHAENHGLQLIGWGQSVKAGGKVASGSAKYLTWYPAEIRGKRPACAATDIYLAAKCVVHLSGGDATTDRFPATVPAEMVRFLKSCLLEGPGMRPGDAWGLLDEFDEVLKSIYGPPQYHRLVMA